MTDEISGAGLPADARVGQSPDAIAAEESGHLACRHFKREVAQDVAAAVVLIQSRN